MKYATAPVRRPARKPIRIIWMTARLLIRQAAALNPSRTLTDPPSGGRRQLSADRN
jgi:hypothetical protein